MGSLENVTEYIELLVDSNTAKNPGGEGIPSNWPLFDYTRYNLRPAGFKIIQAEIPFVFDTIGPNNNKFLVNSTLVTIPPGTYDGLELAAILQSTLITQLGVGWIVSYNANTFRFTFTWTAPFSFTFNENVLGPELNLGFKKGVYASTGLVLTSSDVALPSGPLYLYLNSKSIGAVIKAWTPDRDVSDSQICRIPIDQQKGGVIIYNDPSPEHFFDFIRGPGFNSFDLFLTLGSDEAQVPLDMKGAGFSVKMGLLNYREAGLPIFQQPSFGGRSGPSYLVP